MHWLLYAPLLIVSALYTAETLRSGVGRTDWDWLWTPNAWQNYSWSKFEWPATWRFLAGAGIGIVCGLVMMSLVNHDLTDAAYYGCGGLGVIGGYLWDVTTDTSGNAL
jgi:hypothetical protein